MRRKNRKALLKCIDSACSNGPDSMYVVKRIPRIWGLRAIRVFESVNGCEFDPKNWSHQMMVAGKGRQLMGLRYLQAMGKALAPLASKAS